MLSFIVSYSPSSRAEPRQTERAQVRTRRIVDAPLRKGLADRGRVLEAVTRAWRHDQHAIGIRVRIDDEAKIRSHSVKTCGCLQAFVSDRRQERRDQLCVHCSDLLLAHR